MGGGERIECSRALALLRRLKSENLWRRITAETFIIAEFFRVGIKEKISIDHLRLKLREFNKELQKTVGLSIENADLEMSLRELVKRDVIEENGGYVQLTRRGQLLLNTIRATRMSLDAYEITRGHNIYVFMIDVRKNRYDFIRTVSPRSDYVEAASIAFRILSEYERRVSSKDVDLLWLFLRT